ncbi:MAG: molybdopterin converting factor subunit 1 [SAR202 cluster bacterium]|nr:molybdopterin converting factor subunit 1 [SAR202 cluster bacterium]
MQVKVRLFASYREKAGRPEVELDLPDGATAGDAAREVVRRYPRVTGDPSKLVIAVNHEYATHAAPLRHGDEVALIPPVSGGSGETSPSSPPTGETTEGVFVLITDAPLDPEALTERVRRDSAGAVVTFLGTTRDNSIGRKVLHLEYEAYRPMADNKLAEIIAEMRARWPLEVVAIAHRLGRLEISEISLVVAVSSPHRKDAFAACMYSVDRIKQTVPIWKKEFFVGGEVWIESPEDVAMRESQANKPKEESSRKS